MAQLDVGSPARPPAATGSRLPLPLAVGAGLTLTTAVATDVSGYEHPTRVLVLDLIGELAGAGGELGGTGLQHLLFSEGPAAGMQVLLSVALVVATAGVAHCTGLFEPIRLSPRPRPAAPLDALGRPTRTRDVPQRTRRHRGHAAPVSRRGPPRPRTR